ncbi:MAG: type II secretion system minor pseudopilin GspH [Tatlockia sp.]|jgi:general secretion pathway protein H
MSARTKGFTLIEILVVVLIIGITLGFTLLCFGDFGAGRRAVVNAEQFSSYLKLLQLQAILENNALGITFDKNGYHTHRLNQEKWQPMPAKGMFHERHFPENIVVTVRQSKNTPQIIINASGEISSFLVDFGTVKTPNLARLAVKQGEPVLLKKS